MAQEAFDKLTRTPIPDADGGIFRAGDNVFVIEADVEDASLVACEATDSFVIVFDIPNYADMVGRASDEDFVVILEAKDGAAVVVTCCRGWGNMVW